MNVFMNKKISYILWIISKININKILYTLKLNNNNE